MDSVTETALINASPEKVFAFVSDPNRAPTFLPGLNRISNLSSPDQKVGRTWEWEFNWFGLVLSGKTECRQFEPPQIYQFETLGGAKSRWTYQCKPQDGSTSLELSIEYEVPKNLLAKIASESALAKMNRRRAVEAVANIKTLLEP